MAERLRSAAAVVVLAVFQDWADLGHIDRSYTRRLSWR
jgi:hypothetical protein